MSFIKKTFSKSKKKQPANLETTPPPNPPRNIFDNTYRPGPVLDEQMFSPSQNQYLARMGFVPVSSQHNQFSPEQTYNAFTPDQTYNQFTPTQTNTQVDETQFMLSQPRGMFMPDSDEDEEEAEEVEEEEEEEEEEPPVVRGKGKGIATGSGTQKTKPRLWTADEVEALAKTWVDISEDAAVGKNQKDKNFQMRIWKMWCDRMGKVYRNHKQIYSKWRNISKVAKDFEAIYDEGERNWPSGATAADVLRKAKMLYSETYGTKQPFNVAAELFWETIRQNQKWKKQDSFHEYAVNTKRSKKSSSSQSSDANIGFDMNVEPEDDPLPMGRDQAKRKMKAGSSNTSNASNASNASNRSEDIQKLTEKIDGLQTLKLIELAMADISHQKGIEYQIALQAKKDAARRLGYNLDDIV